jgi:hypothetical protein
VLEDYDDALRRQAQEAQAQRMALWQAIQEKASDLAEFMKAFGKVKLNSVEFR